jgi:two-component SAPR family response regulator
MPLSGYRILIVEDEALIALDLSQVLQQLQAVVVGSVNNMADARKLIFEVKIDCAILDVNLGDDNVAALIPELDARHIPRVFMTAYSEKNLPPAWSVWPAIEKPMVTGDLLRAIERVIEKRAAGHG